MVEVIEKSAKESEFEKKCKKLEQIADETISFKVLIHSTSLGNFGLFDSFSKETMFNVYPHSNKIILDKKKYFNETLKVAEAYEKFTKETWTLKKDYND